MHLGRNKRWQSFGLIAFICVWVIFAATTFAFASEHAAEHSVGHDTEHATGHEAGHSKGWIATDTYRVINFAILAIGLFLVLRKPVSQALDSRIKGIQDQLDELETKKVEAEKKLAEYNDRIIRLDEEVKEIVAGYIKQGEEAKTRILKEAELAATKMEDQAKKNIEHEFETAKKNLKADILEKALLRAEEIVKGKITSEDQNRLVDEYLNKVVT